MALGADDNPVSVKICCVLGFQTQHDSWLAERLTWRRERGQTSVGVHKCTTHTGHSKGYAPLVEVTRTLFFGWWSSFGGNLGPLFRLSERRNLCRVWFIDWILKARQHHVVSILVVCVFSLSVWFVFFLPFVDSFQFKFFKLFCSLAFSKRFSFTSCRALQLHAWTQFALLLLFFQFLFHFQWILWKFYSQRFRSS